MILHRLPDASVCVCVCVHVRAYVYECVCVSECKYICMCVVGVCAMKGPKRQIYESHIKPDGSFIVIQNYDFCRTFYLFRS